MKAFSTILLLALIPTYLISSVVSPDAIHGLWYDDYSDTKLEIQYSRKGIKVKTHGALFGKWRTYNYMGRGLYDDCDGRVIIVHGRNRIEWRKGRRGRSILLTRYADYGNGYFDDYRRSGYSDDRSYNRNYRNDRSRNSDFGGDWYCNDHRLNLRIEISGRGFRAKSGDSWAYYEPYEDHFRDRRGNRYYLNEGNLTWQSYDGKRNLRFGRR